MRHPIDDRVHFSELRQMHRSPAHYRYACEHARDATRAMTIGLIGDAIVFGTPERYALYPGATRRGAEWDAFRAANRGKTICIQSEFDEARGAAEAILRDSVAAPLLAQCEFQVALQWDQMGTPCASGIAGVRGGVDAVNRAERTIWDVKMVGLDCDVRTLSRHAWRQHWHTQLAWLVDGWRASQETNVQHAGLIAVEASPPHAVTVLRMPGPALDEGRKTIRLWLERYKACEESGAWPGYVQDVAELEVPEWLGSDDGD